MSITIETCHHENLIIITVTGRLDDAGVKEIAQALADLASVQDGIVINMKDVPYINTAGLRVLAEFLTRKQLEGRSAVSVVLHPRVHRIFEITGFNRFFHIFDDLDDLTSNRQ